MEYVYDPTALTPNMHMHLHVRESLKDFGPACASWVFAFERYNGIYKGYNSNQRKNFELTFMSHFLQNVHASDYLEMVKNSLDDDSYGYLFNFIDKAKNSYIPDALVPDIRTTAKICGGLDSKAVKIRLDLRAFIFRLYGLLKFRNQN
ncbi:hypothetical protein G6F56_010151 [Rhizopus delemar]|nr:hypothetical protein G6F56_010151 [Rhizopus delemar]